MADDNMGSDENITNKTLQHLAQEKGKSLQEVQMDVYKMLESGEITDHHVEEMFVKASKVWKQSIEEAKKNTQELLKQELKIKN